MKQYIEKDALVAEIERRISNLEQLGNRLFVQTNFPEQYRLIHGYESVLSFIGTMEVKEVGNSNDAFIEKACEWLKENGGSYWMDDYDLPTDDLVSDFKNYMKGG